MSSADQLGEALAEDYETRSDITLDLSELTFLDSSGLQVILAASSKLGKNGDLILRNASHEVALVFELSGLDRVRGIRIER